MRTTHRNYVVMTHAYQQANVDDFVLITKKIYRHARIDWHAAKFSVYKFRIRNGKNVWIVKLFSSA